MMPTYQLFESGYCRHCARMTLQTGDYKNQDYPAICALINHPVHGFILFDTGYSHDFYDCTRRMPYALYRHLTPVHLQHSLKEQLMQYGVQPDEINYIVISHFHADHVSGLKDFPKAQFICHQAAYDSIQNKGSFRLLLQGFLPDLLPHDFERRLILLNEFKACTDPCFSMFRGMDLFFDQSMVVIELPGHAKGQIGLYVRSSRPVFLVGDACWHEETYKHLIYPSEFSYLLHDNKQQYIKTIEKIHDFHKKNDQVLIVPSHCLHVRQHVYGVGS